MRRLAALAWVLALAAAGCGGSSEAAPPPPELTGVITEVHEEGGTVRGFTIDSLDGIFDVRVADDVDYGFDLRHLYEHERTREPVRLDVEQRGDTPYALAIVDAPQ